MYRYTAQMRGGALSKAWAAIALYGLLQPVHVFLVALWNPELGFAFSVGVDNFIILGAYASLAFGPIFQVEANSLCREQPDTNKHE
jgi:hypothetical protein